MFIFAKIMNQYVGRRGYILAVVTSAVVVFIIALLIENSAGYLRGLQAAQLKCGGPCSPEVSIQAEIRSNLNLIHVKIGLGFLASVFGLSLRRTFGFFLSLAGLIWVAVTYVAWHVSTSRFDAEYATAHGFFRDANWLDWVILLITIMLIIWHLVVAMRLIRRDKVSSKPA